MKIKDLLEGSRPIVSKVICSDGTEKGFVCNKKTYNFLHNIEQSDKNSITTWANKYCKGTWKVETTNDYVGEERYGGKE